MVTIIFFVWLAILVLPFLVKHLLDISILRPEVENTKRDGLSKTAIQHFDRILAATNVEKRHVRWPQILGEKLRIIAMTFVVVLGVVGLGCTRTDQAGSPQVKAEGLRTEVKAVAPSPIQVNQLSGADFQAQVASLLSNVEWGELSPVQAFDVLITTASEFKPVTSFGVETPAYAESRIKSQALDAALEGLVDRTLRALPAEAGERKATLDHLRTKLEPFAKPPGKGEIRWCGANLNQVLYRIAKQQELVDRTKH